MAGQLTTHVLDISLGKPAQGMKIELWLKAESEGDPSRKLREVRTNQDGRMDAPLLSGEELLHGVYELVFFVGDYFRERELEPGALPFLDKVPVCFGVSDSQSHYHVPLLVAPGGYSTYRGS
jgi:hydroxyisourate hydrolase